MPRKPLKESFPPKVLTLYGIQVPAEEYHTLCRLAAIFYGKTYAATMSQDEAQRASARYALEVLDEWRRRQRSHLQEILVGSKGDPD